MKDKTKTLLLLLVLLVLLIGCNKAANSNSSNNATKTATELTSDLFSERDLKQTIDTSDATKYTVSDNKNIEITKEGVYEITGNATNITILVNVDKEEKVQIVLNNLTIINNNKSIIYIMSADKVFVTAAGTNNLTVNNTFTKIGDTNTDAVIYSKEDLVINGTGTLNIKSPDNGITSKDDLKVTGGTINIECKSDCLEANESIAIAGGNITIKTEKDGLHSENSSDSTTGYIYILDGTITIDSGDDAIHATTILQIDGGTLNLNASEGLESTFVQINGGTIDIKASDDGINATSKTTLYTATIEINDCNLTISMGPGDTDAMDVNGNLYINGGTINITAQSAFDYDSVGELNGGTVTVNGTEVTELTKQQMGPGGGRGGNPGDNRRNTR